MGGRLFLSVSAVMLAILTATAFCADGAPETGGLVTLDLAERMIKDGQAAAAYTKLAPLELDWSGDPRFDYLFGLAALDSGHAADAAFCLERVVAVQPDFLGARMELARAHYEAGDTAAASAQFDYLLKQNPPESTRAVIESYRAAIVGRSGQRDRLTPFLEFGSGYDSNANGSTSESQFLGFTLDAKNVRRDSSFIDLAAGLTHVHAFNPALGVATDFRAGQRWNPSASFVNQTQISAASRLVAGAGTLRGSVGVDGYYGWLSGSPHEWGLAVEFNGAWRAGPGLELSTRLRGGPVRFEDASLEVLDVTRYLGSVGASYAFPTVRAARLSVDLVYGRDDARLSSSAYNNDRYGTRVSTSLLVLPNTSAYAEAGWLRSKYDDNPGFFGIDRRDDQYYVVGALEFQGWPIPGISVAPRMRFIRNTSNVSLYEYDRWEAGVYARYIFR